MTERGTDQKKEGSEVKTFPVPFSLGEIKENIVLNTNNQSKPTKEQLINKAVNFHSQGNLLQAIKYYQQLINQGSKDHKIFSNYGIILRDLGKLKEADLLMRKAIELNPDSAIANSNLGMILIDLNNLHEAQLYTRRAIELKPDYSEAHFNLGVILKGLGKSKEAELSTRKAIELKPDFADAHLQLGNILRDLGKLKEAELSTRNAIKFKPDFADAYFNLSLLELLQGDYEAGLENYEYRFKKKDAKKVLNGFPITRKVEVNDLRNVEKILVISEQGLGDTLQFMRYVPYLKSKGFHIDFCAQPELHSLIKVSGIDQRPLMPNEANIFSKAKLLPLLSLPKFLKISPNNPIISNPYIFSTDELKKKWRNILSKESKPIIGINWQGNPEVEKTMLRGRSLPLEIFSILDRNNNFKFLSLQKGFGSDQLDHCSFKNKFVQCQNQIDCNWDFLETAAIISNCNVVITSDTSVAHLSGGLGKTTWLLLRDIPEWRWGLKGESTFWYPSMRLFRQKERFNWNEVMERVSIELEKGIVGTS